MAQHELMSEREFSDYIRTVSAVPSLGGTCWHEILEIEDRWFFNIDEPGFSVCFDLFRDRCFVKFGTRELNAFNQGGPSLEWDMSDPAERKDFLRVLSNAFQLGYEVRTVRGWAVRVRVFRPEGAEPDRYTLNPGSLLPSFVGQWYHASPPSA